MKKGFTLIELMIVAAIIVILALIAYPMYDRYIKYLHSEAAKATLKLIDQAEREFNAQEADKTYVGSKDLADMKLLTDLGFRPDPNVAFNIQTTPDGGFVAFAANTTPGSPIFVYDNTNASGVVLWDQNYAPPAGINDPGEGRFNTYAFTPATAAGGPGGAGVEAKVEIAKTCSFENPEASDTKAGKVLACNAATAP